MELDREKKVFLVAGAVIGLAFMLLISGSGGDSSSADWKTAELTDVRTGENFSISGFDKPVLVETFAVWCPTCTRQQQEVKKLHDRFDGFVSVSLDVDPNEDAEKVRNHVQRHGFDWYYAVAPVEVSASLRQEYGSSILRAPEAPMVLVCPDGETRRLSNGVKPASKLEEEIREGC